MLKITSLSWFYLNLYPLYCITQWNLPVLNAVHWSELVTFALYSIFSSRNKYTVLSIEEGSRQKEGKGRRCWLGDVLECRTKIVRSILVGWWLFGMVWTGWSSIFAKHPFRQVAVIILILYFKSSWWKIARAARNWINSVPQTAATTVAFSSVFILLLWVWYLYSDADDAKTVSISVKALQITNIHQTTTR